MTNAELIKQAEKLIRPHTTKDGRLLGDVGAALVSDSGAVYLGVCIDTASGTGFDAEAVAIGTMVTAGEYKIKKIVAVWKDERDGKLYVLPPCGRCRLFISQIHESNLDCDVILGKHKVVKLQQRCPTVNGRNHSRSSIYF